MPGTSNRLLSVPQIRLILSQMARHAYVLWAAAALIAAPAFIPSGFTFGLFMIHAVAALAFSGIALIMWRRRKAAGSASLLRSGLFVAAPAVAVGASFVLSDNGGQWLTPDDARLQHVLEERLLRQGADVPKLYPDLRVSGSRCFDEDAVWSCVFDVSYRDGGDTVNAARQWLKISTSTGEEQAVAPEDDCELPFQWSKRLREMSVYKSRFEPVEWDGCVAEGDVFRNSIRSSADDQGHGSGATRISIEFPRNDRAAKARVTPLTGVQAEQIVRAQLQDVDIRTIACRPAIEGPNSSAVTCDVTGTQTVHDPWLAMSNPYSNGSGLVGLAYRKRLTVRPNGLVWSVN